MRCCCFDIIKGFLYHQQCEDKIHAHIINKRNVMWCINYLEKSYKILNCKVSLILIPWVTASIPICLAIITKAIHSNALLENLVSFTLVMTSTWAFIFTSSCIHIPYTDLIRGSRFTGKRSCLIRFAEWCAFDRG